MMALCSTATNNAGDVRRQHRCRSAITICDGKACCDAKLACEIASAILAFVAAVFWFYASWIARGTFTQTPIVDLDGIFLGKRGTTLSQHFVPVSPPSYKLSRGSCLCAEHSLSVRVNLAPLPAALVGRGDRRLLHRKAAKIWCKQRPHGARGLPQSVDSA